MSDGLPALCSKNALTPPAVVILPILPLKGSVNQTLPSGPTAIPCGPLPLGRGNSVNAGLILPILSPLNSVNQRSPSGPAAIPSGPPSNVTRYSVIMGALVSAKLPVVAKLGTAAATL